MYEYFPRVKNITFTMNTTIHYNEHSFLVYFTCCVIYISSMNLMCEWGKIHNGNSVMVIVM